LLKGEPKVLNYAIEAIVAALVELIEGIEINVHSLVNAPDLEEAIVASIQFKQKE